MWPEDKDLELIFREGSKKYDHSYDPAAWDQMDTMLNNQRRRKFFMWFVAGAIVLLSAWGLYHYVDGGKKSGVPIVEVSATSVKENNEVTSLIKTQTNNTTSQNSNEKSTLSNTQTPLTYKVDKKSANPIPTFQSSSFQVSAQENANEIANTSSTKQLNSLVNKKTSDSSTGERNDVIKGSFTSDNQVINGNNPLTETIAIQESKSTITSTNEDNTETNQAASAISMAVISQLNINPLDARFDISQQPKLVHVLDLSKISFKRFMISGFAGVESSWTPNGELSSVDISLGVKGSYLVSQKLAFSLGANYRADKFTAGRTDYNPDPSFWESGIIPMFTTADNDMLEISTGLVFSPSGAHNNGILLSGLLVSNIMLRENYNYNFEDTNSNFENSWRGSNNTLFSNLELGVGYRRQLKDGFSIELSPYIKIPVNGIGHGDLMLSSYGLRMAINLGL